MSQKSEYDYDAFQNIDSNTSLVDKIFNPTTMIWLSVAANLAGMHVNEENARYCELVNEISKLKAEHSELKEYTDKLCAEVDRRYKEVERLDIFDFNKTGKIEKQIIATSADFKITALSLEYGAIQAELKLRIENRSNKGLTFTCGRAGLSRNSINGYMVHVGYMCCELREYEEVEETISFDYSMLNGLGITEIADIGLGIRVSDEERIMDVNVRIQTILFDRYNYEKECYQGTIEKCRSIESENFKVVKFETYKNKSIYNENGVKLISSAIIGNKDNRALMLEFENTGDYQVELELSDITLNNLRVDTTDEIKSIICRNKKCIMTVSTESVEYRDVYGLDEICKIGLAIVQQETEYITNKKVVSFEISDKAEKYDDSGYEVYNKNGLRIVTKKLVKDDSEYSNDINTLMLAENRGNETVSIECDFEGLTVNGKEIDYLYDGTELRSEEASVIKIVLMSDSLEDNGIFEIGDIKEIRMKIVVNEETEEIKVYRR